MSRSGISGVGNPASPRGCVVNRVAVEQAIAYGGIDYAVETLGVSRDLAEKVLAWMGNPTGRPPLPEGRQVQPCGTHAAYIRHRRAGEQCRTCKDAERVRGAERRARERAS